MRDSRLEIGKVFIDRGYYHFHIEDFSIDKSSVNGKTLFNLSIFEGPQTIVRNIIIDSVSRNDSVNFANYFEFLSGEVFVQSELEQRLQIMTIKILF